MNASHNVLTEAVRLLVDIAGTDPVHIEMSARGPKKYYDVRRMFDERDGRAHLLGYRTKGATLRHPDGMTRALCYDADTPGDWQLLQEAAQVLADAQGTLLATDGRSAARVLLDYQTPVSVVQNTRVETGFAGQYELLSPVTHQQEARAQRSRPQQHNTGEVDVYWHEKYNRFLWFQFTPAQLAAIYNEQHPLQNMLHLEQNGMAFSPSVEERTPSTAITNDGRAWVDFSARSIQLDGKCDGGDALELEARRKGETKTAKPATLRKVACTLVREARAALEDAARVGENPPTWVAQIMTEAGWQHYRFLCAESAATR